MSKSILFAALLVALLSSSSAMVAVAQSNTGPSRILIVGHRGASGYLPEHTLEAYRLAIAQGADFIEPDLVATKDGTLIARHEPMLGATTDVADRPAFAGRKTTRKVDGIDTTDFFASDFTLAEIKTLRAKQAMAERDQSHNGKYEIPTFDEVIALAKAESRRTSRVIGVYPETKHPTYHAALGLPLEPALLDALAKAGWTDKSSPAIVQSFETANLKHLRRHTNVRLVQLVDADDVDKDGNVVLAAPYDRPNDFAMVGDKRTYKELLTKDGLAEIKTYADGVGPWKPYLLSARQADANGDGKPDDLSGDGKIDEQDRVLLEPTTVVKDAHAAGLFVHTWTFRSEPRRLASNFKSDPSAEYNIFAALGIDGLFTDFPDHAEDCGYNGSANPTMGDLIAARFNRRDLLQGILAVAAIGATVSPITLARAARAQSKTTPSFDFKEVTAGSDEKHHVAEGYDAEILIRWGDPVLPGAPPFDPRKQTPEAQAKQFGYNSDYLGYVPLDGSRRGLLVINHEYTNEELMFPQLPGRQDLRNVAFKDMTKELVDIEIMAHGGSVIEVAKGADGKWSVVPHSRYARRITGETEIRITGPAAGHDRMKTSYDPSGRKVRGMLNNCAGGRTPWGTWVTCEENFNGYFWGTADGHPDEKALKRYGAPGNWYNWGRLYDRFDVAKEPNEINRFGWVVEIDPMDPNSLPKSVPRSAA